MALRKFTAAVWAAIATSSVSMSALAAPVVYNFNTGTAFAGSAAVLSQLGGGAISVSGSFVYDAASPFTANSQDLGFEPGRALYTGAVSQISGTVNGHDFVDSGVGTVAVGNEAVAPGDWFSLNADPSPRVGENTTPAEYARSLVGFTVGGYTLNNVRLYWVEGYSGAPDFLSNNDLLPAPPSFNGVLALDFVLASDPTNTANVPYYSRTVYFGGLTAQAAAVPEPGALALGLVGMAGMLVAARHRKAKAARA